MQMIVISIIVCPTVFAESLVVAFGFFDRRDESSFLSSSPVPVAGSLKLKVSKKKKKNKKGNGNSMQRKTTKV